MSNYLRGYLASVPPSEYQNIIDFLKDYLSSKTALSEEELESLLYDILQQRELTTLPDEALKTEKPLDTYNRFFSRTGVDLLYLFKIIDALNKAIDSYAYLSSSYLSEIKTEINKLKLRIDDLERQKTIEQNIVTVHEEFQTTTSFEKYTSETAYLFTDRDGAALPPAELSVNKESSRLILKTIQQEDLLHNKHGKTIGVIEVTNFRGVPSSTYANRQMAIDNSETSYWDCSVASDNKIEVPLDQHPAGGAYIRFKVKLSKAHKISQISLDPYCIYPLEVCEIKIEDENVIAYLPDEQRISSQTVNFNFRPIASDEVEITLRQKNYNYEVLRINEKEEEVQHIINLMLKTPMESHTREPVTLEDLVEKHSREISVWNDEYARGGE